jgi:adenylosuccinate synthase
VTGDRVFKLHHLPSGILHDHVLSIMGNGMVVDPFVLLTEIDNLRAQGIAAENLRISDRAHLIMPWHRIADAARERAAGERKIGTTGRGIGPAYADKMARRGIRFTDLLEKETFRDLAARVYGEYGAFLEGLPPLSSIIREYREYAELLHKYVTDTSMLIMDELRLGKAALFEGAQGMMLDIDHGTYPYVTSSNVVSGNVATGLGIPPSALGRTVGIAKAYTTRVGTGPFPTELHGAESEHLRNKGEEYGTTTGRPRRCGCLDLVILRQAVRINGIDSLALTKLDVLEGLTPLRVAVAYRYGGATLHIFPASMRAADELEPVYEYLEGWDGDLARASSRAELPRAAQRYVTFIEEFLGVPVSIISVGPDEKQTILDQGPGGKSTC